MSLPRLITGSTTTRLCFSSKCIFTCFMLGIKSRVSMKARAIDSRHVSRASGVVCCHMSRVGIVYSDAAFIEEGVRGGSPLIVQLKSQFGPAFPYQAYHDRRDEESGDQNDDRHLGAGRHVSPVNQTRREEDEARNEIIVPLLLPEGLHH